MYKQKAQQSGAEVNNYLKSLLQSQGNLVDGFLGFFQKLFGRDACRQAEQMWKDADRLEPEKNWKSYLLRPDNHLAVVLMFLTKSIAVRYHRLTSALWEAHSNRIIEYLGTLRNENLENNNKFKFAENLLLKRSKIDRRALWDSLEDVFVVKFFIGKTPNQIIENFKSLLVARFKYAEKLLEMWNEHVKDIVKTHFDSSSANNEDKINFFNVIFIRAPKGIVEDYVAILQVDKLTNLDLQECLLDKIAGLLELEELKRDPLKIAQLNYLKNTITRNSTLVSVPTASSICSTSASSMTSSSVSAGSSSSSSFSSSSSSSGGSVSYSPGFFQQNSSRPSVNQQQNTPSSSSSSSLTSTDDDVSRSSQRNFPRNMT